MHWYRTVAQIFLIFSIPILVLAAPIVVQPVHEARGDETVVTEDVAVMPKQSHVLETVSDRSTFPRSPPGAMGPPQHSDPSDSGYSWMLGRPPGLSLTLPASLHESESPQPSSSGPSDSGTQLTQELEAEMPPSLHLPAPFYDSAYPRPSSSVSSEIPDMPLPERLQDFAPGAGRPPSPHPSSSGPGSLGIPDFPLPEWLEEFAQAPERTPSPPLPMLQGSASPLASPRPSSSGLSEIPPSQPTGPDRATTETYPSPDRFRPLHDPLSSTGWHSDESMSSLYSSASGVSAPSLYSSASGVSVPSFYSSASDVSVPSLYSSTSGELVPSHDSMPERLASLHHSTSDGTTLPGHRDFFTEFFTRLGGAH